LIWQNLSRDAHGVELHTISPTTIVWDIDELPKT